MMALTMVVAVGGEKWSNSRYIFKVNLICFTDRLGMELREVKDDCKIFSLNN